MRRFTPIPLLAALLAAVLLAGCGGDDSGSDSTAAATQPQAELVKQADAICSQASAQGPKAPELSANPTPEQLRSAAAYFEGQLAATKKTRDQLAELAPPEGLEQEWSTILDGFQRVIDAYPDLIDAARAGDSKAFIDEIKQLQLVATDIVPAAGKIGLSVCGAR